MNWRIFWLLMVYLKTLPAYQAPDMNAIQWAKDQSTRIENKTKAQITNKVAVDEIMDRYLKPNKQLINPVVKNNPVYVFVSFSMPEESLRQWLLQINQVGGVMVIRGFVHNSLKETVNIISLLLNGKEGHIQIDPFLFKKYDIHEVPSLVLAEDNDFDRVEGDVPLRAALEFIVKDGSQREFAKKLLNQMNSA